MGQEGFNRRQALGVGAGAAAVAGAALVPGTAGAQAGDGELKRRAPEDLVPRQNIGIQLFTLRDMQAASVEDTINLLGGIGYPEVELFTMQGQTAATWRGFLEAANVRAVGAHVGIDRWRGELDTVLDEAETLGMPYVGVPGIFDATRPTTRQGYSQLAREFNRLAERVADRGMRFYYHNHNFEFARDGGIRLYDVLLNDTDPDLVFFEMDLYWTVTAGVDPLDYLSTYDQSRWPLFHVKDRDAAGTFADLGEGNINFARIFRELQNKHYHHYIVERDTQVDPERTASVGYEYLRGLQGRRRRRPYSPQEAGSSASAARARGTT
jgi:sugar phosphate isomerase/epimerase